MRKIKVKMNKPIYLGMSKLDISKIPMCEFWYDYLKTTIKKIFSYVIRILIVLYLM